MDTTARHPFIIPPTPQDTRLVQLRGSLRRKLRPGAVSTRHGMAMPDGRFPRAKQGNPGMRSPSPTMPYCLYSMLFYTTSLGPSVGEPTAMYTPPMRYKREEYVKPGQVKADTIQARIHSEQSCSQPLESTSNTTHSGRMVLRSGGPNHSKPAVFIVFLSRLG